MALAEFLDQLCNEPSAVWYLQPNNAVTKMIYAKLQIESKKIHLGECDANSSMEH